MSSRLFRRGLSIVGITCFLLGFLCINKIEYSRSVLNFVYPIVIDFEEPLNEDELIDKTLYSLTGFLTGYAADCPMCNGTLACLRNYNVYKNGIVNYNDKTFGNVRIVASSKNLSCGSIVEFDNTKAIVLDRGVLGNNLDLLVESESYASKYVGRKKITYDVLREGW